MAKIATPSVKFLSYNGTGLDTIKARWLRDLFKVTKVDFCSIQEHFKKNKGKFFKENFTDFNTYFIPAFREKERDSGRAKGGLAQLSSTKYKVKTVRIPTKNFRLQAQVLHFPNTVLLWINSYFPTDPLTVRFDETELLEVLNEAEDIMDKTEFDNILWGGDFNWDPMRVTGFSETVGRFMEKIGLVSLWERFSISHTHIHTDFKSTATLDHFMVNEGLLTFIKDAGALHLGDNLSRHSPIMVKINVGDIPVCEKKKGSRPRKPAWYKSEQEDRDHFSSLLHHQLSLLPIPQSLHCSDPLCTVEHHSQERDNFVLDIMSSVIEVTHQTIPMSGGGRSKPKDPNKCCPIEKTIPGWYDEVKPFKKDAVFWHSVWQSAGRPTRGALRDVMASTRNKYHYAVRRVKKMANAIRAKKLLEASETGSVNLLKEMKKIKGDKKSSDNLPDRVAGVTGENLIVEEFRKMYGELYNSCDTSTDMATLGEKIKNLITVTSVEDVNLISGSVVKEAAGRLKPGKGDVTGSYTSDTILNAPDIFFENIAMVFKSWLVHGTVTKTLLACAFLPLFKGGLKDPSQTGSYRAIAGASLLLKLFDYVILTIWGDLLGSDSLQFGYKRNTSTTQCSWLVMEVAGYFLRRGTPCIVTLLDCSKAFDTCTFKIIFDKLLSRKVPPVVIRSLMFVYQKQTAWVRWGTATSSCFGVLNGTRQGSVLSPFIFAIYMDELLEELRKLGVGCHIGNTFFGAAGFADDVVLLAPSRSAMQLMLKVCQEFGIRNNLQYSTDPDPAKSKTKCLYMCGKPSVTEYPAPLLLHGRELPWVKTGTHLGHELHQTCKMNHDAKIKRATFISESTDIREMFHFAHPQQVLSAVSVYTSHMYGSMLWDLFGDEAGQVYRSWNTCVKLAWNLPRATHNYYVDNSLSGTLPSLRKKLLCQYVGFFRKLLHSASWEIRVLANTSSADGGSVTGRNLRNIQQEFNLCPWTSSLVSFKKNYNGYKVPDEDKWRLPFLGKLIEQCREMTTCGEDTSTITGLIDSLCVS